MPSPVSWSCEVVDFVPKLLKRRHTMNVSLQDRRGEKESRNNVSNVQVLF